MQPLYDDEYGVLQLASKQPLDPRAESLYKSREDFSDPVSWFIRVKYWFLSKIKVLKVDSLSE